MYQTDLKEMQQREQKKKNAFQDMLVALEMKEEQKKAIAELEKKENAKYSAYVKELDSRE